MRRVAFSYYFLPHRIKGRRPYASSWKMSPEEADSRGALGVVSGSTELRELPDTEDELKHAQTFYQSAGRDSVKPPKE